MTQPNGDHPTVPSENPVPEYTSPDTVEQVGETAPQTEAAHTPEKAQTPPPEPKSSGGLSAGIWASLIIGALILVLLLIFIIQNNEPTQFYYFGWQFTLPLGVSILLAAIAGIVIAGIFGTVRMFILGRQIKRARKR
ncbi:DUF1049 domain-containing protein [Brevibacterium ravenspurgense]|uniref:DUF1049 domain-containing protein n=1 Tax=Brevibacterium ravenspurgense TaxID=479117 RepID=A0A2I1IJ66_9MICO|nr:MULTISPECIES: LapA family protein [Brevibacterium]MCG7300085.1 LapA family protein [Brevibacterium ravenspurgense]OFT96784.1 hypothetical protein HMPREF3087_06885 [Brevibacterium sp. HMSC22B09]PKY71161.1 DUF1049 domain-containing protein [Brevibacterium ravenspurgense]